MTKQSKTSIMTLVKALFKKETPLYIKGTVALALAYTVFPVDVLPDIFGPLGFVDDAAVVGVLTTIAITLLNNFYEKQSGVTQASPNQHIKMADVVEK
ncbi:YkvA family protein [Aerococcaceae bacterium WGS1372]